MPFAFYIHTLFSGFINFANHAVNTDLKDIPNVYGLTRAAAGTENELEYVANGPNCFWVAELCEEGVYPEVVGCCGLGAFRLDPSNVGNPISFQIISAM
jgi:hypothetical protein